MEDRNNIPHTVVIDNREHMTASGVQDVDSFDEQTIIAFTSMGEMTVSGVNLRINRFSAEVGELIIDGNICNISYSDNKPSKGGFFAGLFR